MRATHDEQDMRTNLSSRLAKRGGPSIRRTVAITEPFTKPGLVYAERFGKMKQNLALREHARSNLPDDQQT